MNENEENNNLEYWSKLPKNLREELAHPLYQVKYEDMDLLFIMDGEEGVGKSQGIRLIGKACSEVLGTDFTPENIHYDPKEYMRSADRSQKSVHVLDEAGVTLDIGSGHNKTLKRFVRYMQVARGGKNNVHILVLPAFHILNKYLVNWRCRFVIHMWAEKEEAKVFGGFKTRRGAFNLYKKDNYLIGCWKKASEGGWYDYPKVWRVRDRLPNIDPFTPEEVKIYEDKKNKWRSEYVNDEEEAKERKSPKKDKLMKIALQKLSEIGITEAKLASMAGVSQQYVNNLTNKQ
jgi:hypothetical protein